MALLDAMHIEQLSELLSCSQLSFALWPLGHPSIPLWYNKTSLYSCIFLKLNKSAVGFNEDKPKGKVDLVLVLFLSILI